VSKPKVSVIVPIFRVEKYLMQCVDSILAQTLKDIEVILVDEGDRDPCYAIMRLYEQEDPRVRIIHKKHGGYGASVNAALDKVSGEFVSIIESDDFIERTMLADMYEKAIQLNVDVVKCAYFDYWEETGDTEETKKLCDYASQLNRALPSGAFSIFEYPQLMAVHASLWSGLYSASLFSNKGIRFIEGKGAGYVDVLFRIETLVEADRIAWLGVPYYNYRRTNMGSSTNNFDLDAIIDRWHEAHDYFESKPADVYGTVGPWSIYDEALNTFCYLEVMEVSEDQFQRMKSNLNRIDEAVIKNSKKLNLRQKFLLERIVQSKDLAQFKSRILPTVYSSRSFRHLIYRMVGVEFFFRHNLVELKLMPGINRRIFSLAVMFFNRLRIQFSVGKP